MRTSLIVISLLVCLLIGCNNAQTPSETKVVKYRIVDSFEENKGRFYDVLFEDDEVTIKDVEKILRKIADEKIKTDKPDELILNAKLESEIKRGNTSKWAVLMWDPNGTLTEIFEPDGETREDNNNTPENNDQFIFMDWSDSYILSHEEIIEHQEREYKFNCSEYSYDELARNPDVYKGRKIKLSGAVVQLIEEGNNEVLFLVNMSKDKHPDYLWTDSVLVKYTRPAGEARILEEDIINIWGLYNGLSSYRAVSGEKITIPFITAKYTTPYDPWAEEIRKSIIEQIGGDDL